MAARISVMLSFPHQIRLVAGARLKLPPVQGHVPTAVAYREYPEKSRTIEKLFPSIPVVRNEQPLHRLGPFDPTLVLMRGI